MSCLRCQGMLVKEQIFTPEGSMSIARCIHCGDQIDSVILANRIRFRLLPPLLGSRKRRSKLPHLTKPIAI